MNTQDARQLKIRQYDAVTVENRNGTKRIQCTVQLMPGIRPGTVAFARGFGYRELGACRQTIDGLAIAPDKTRGTGVNPDALAVREGPLVVRVGKS
jgi:anaerobic selenocysteine-containing dehydrogenase